MELLNYNSIITDITFKQYQIGILRLDLIDTEISGNKWFKLKYNIQEAIRQQKKTILTFGGAFSNHIAATAKACQLAGLQSVGIIRGEETTSVNPTLFLARQNGMNIQFINRKQYKGKSESCFLAELQKQYPECYIIPEGGDNALGEKGCEEILTEATNQYLQVFCAYGTGTTFKGIAQSLQPYQQLIAINVLKFEAIGMSHRASVNNQYHFGGYAKHTSQLLEFKTWFEKEYHIQLDYVYTAKLFYAVFDLMRHHKIDTTQKILIIHSGGLQGNEGYKQRYHVI